MFKKCFKEDTKKYECLKVLINEQGKDYLNTITQEAIELFKAMSVSGASLNMKCGGVLSQAVNRHQLKTYKTGGV